MVMSLISPDWPRPDRVTAYSTTRQGGISQGSYASLNLATHVADDPNRVLQNRRRLLHHAQLPSEPIWLDQVHGTRVLILSGESVLDSHADAVYSRTPGQVCAVLTADCLPLLMCSSRGNEVAAVHAGWRGLAAGVIEQTVAQFAVRASQLLVWLGPAIGPHAFVVDTAVREQFLLHHPEAASAFVAYPVDHQPAQHYLADLYTLARQRLHALGVQHIYGGDRCTFTETEHFFSYRRDNQTGRMASLIWLT